MSLTLNRLMVSCIALACGFMSEQFSDTYATIATSFTTSSPTARRPWSTREALPRQKLLFILKDDHGRFDFDGQIGTDSGIRDSIDKPKGMRWATFDRKMDRVEAAEAVCNAYLSMSTQKLT